MKAHQYDGFRTSEIQAHAAYQAIRARDPQGLPGDIERGDNNARLLFQLNGQEEWRYFRTEAQAHKTKATYRGIWRPAWVNIWHHKDLMWV